MRTKTFPKAMVGQRIRQIRKKIGFTVEQLAHKVGVSQSMISQIETGQVSPSLDTLWKLSYYLEVPIFQFFKHLEHTPVQVTRKNEHKPVKMIHPNVWYELLSPTTDCKIELLKMTVKPGDVQDSPALSHTGEECGYLIQGRLTVIVNGETYQLQAGDSIYFDSTLPHKFHNPGEEDAVAIWAMTSSQ